MRTKSLDAKCSKNQASKNDRHPMECKEGKEQNPKQGDTFAIYQLRLNRELLPYRFQSLKRLEAAGLSVNRANYEKEYEAPLADGMTLDQIYYIFNLERPEDYKGDSLSVSDVIVLNKDGTGTAYYVDSGPFQEVPGFLEGGSSHE